MSAPEHVGATERHVQRADSGYNRQRILKMEQPGRRREGRLQSRPVDVQGRTRGTG